MQTHTYYDTPYKHIYIERERQITCGCMFGGYIDIFFPQFMSTH